MPLLDIYPEEMRSVTQRAVNPYYVLCSTVHYNQHTVQLFPNRWMVNKDVFHIQQIRILPKMWRKSCICLNPNECSRQYVEWIEAVRRQKFLVHFIPKVWNTHKHKNAEPRIVVADVVGGGSELSNEFPDIFQLWKINSSRDELQNTLPLIDNVVLCT